MMRSDPAAHERREQESSRLDAFVRRAADEGLLRTDLPAGWARAMLDQLVDLVAHQFTDLAPGPAADLVVDSLLRGVSPTREPGTRPGPA
jgi:hypothetical protein